MRLSIMVAIALLAGWMWMLHGYHNELDNRLMEIGKKHNTVVHHVNKNVELIGDIVDVLKQRSNK